MKSRRLLVLILALAVVFTAGLVGCNKGPANIDKEQFLTLNIGDDAKTLDSCLANDSVGFDVIAQTFEGIAREGNDGTKDVITPAGATKWDISKDGLTWTFHLRDLKWSDDQKVTAQDYEYAWKRLLNPKLAAQYASFIFCIEGAEEYYTEKGKVEDVKIKAVDEKTFEIKLKYPVPYFEQILPFKCLMPLRKDIVEAQGDSYGQDCTKMVYNGPFLLTDWVKGQKFVLKKNEKYWNESKIYLDEVTMVMVSEPATFSQMFENGEIDQTGASAEWKEKFEKASKEGKYTYQTGYMPISDYLQIRQKSNPILANKKVRTALALSFSRETYLNTIYKRLVPAYGMVPFGISVDGKVYREASPEPLKKLADENKDMAKLKQMFEEGCREAGVEPANAKVKLLLRSATTRSRQIGEFIQNAWKTNLGLTCELEFPADFATYLRRTANQEFEIAHSGWQGDYDDPMTFLDMWETGNGNNDCEYTNATFDKCIQDARKEQDAAKRLKLYQQAEQALVGDDIGVIPIDYQDKHSFFQPYVKELQMPMFGATWELTGCYTTGRDK